MKNLLIAFWRDENGQTSTEYILLVAVVFMIVMKFRDTATTQLGQITEDIFGGMRNISTQVNQAAGR